MLRDSKSGPRDHKCRGRRNVERVPAVTAGPAGIDDKRISYSDPDCAVPHSTDRSGDLFDSFAFQTEPHQVRGNLRGRSDPVHDFIHDLLRFFLREREAISQFGDGVFDHETTSERLQLEEIAEEIFPRCRQDGFRMELHPFDTQTLVAKAHDFALSCLGGYFEAGG